MSRKGFTLIELLIVVAIVGTLALIVLGQCGTYSEGWRAGVVQKFSNKGTLGCKSWEGELLLGGSNPNSGQGAANVWQFSVQDPSVVNDIQSALDSGERVRLTYSEKPRFNPCTQDTPYTVTAVTVMQE